MRKLIILLTLMTVSLVLGAYEQWDVVGDFSWKDSDGGEPVQRSLHGLVDEGKVVLMSWGYKG